MTRDRMLMLVVAVLVAVSVVFGVVLAVVTINLSTQTHLTERQRYDASLAGCLDQNARERMAVVKIRSQQAPSRLAGTNLSTANQIATIEAILPVRDCLAVARTNIHAAGPPIP